MLYVRRWVLLSLRSLSCLYRLFLRWCPTVLYALIVFSLWVLPPIQSLAAPNRVLYWFVVWVSHFIGFRYGEMPGHPVPLVSAQGLEQVWGEIQKGFTPLLVQPNSLDYLALKPFWCHIYLLNRILFHLSTQAQATRQSSVLGAVLLSGKSFSLPLGTVQHHSPGWFCL